MAIRSLALVLGVVAALAAGAIGAGAQPTAKVYRIGYLDTFALAFGKPSILDTALRELGWVEKRNHVFESRFADRKPERLAEFAAELARLKVDVIVARGTEAAVAAKRATRNIPIVFSEVADPVGAGLVASLARPGGNITGLASASGEAAVKQLDLLREMLPGLALVDVLWVGMTEPDASVWRELQASGRQLRIALRSTVVPDRPALERALGSLRQSPPGAALVYADEFEAGYLITLGDFAIRQRLPMASNARALTWNGGLMSYSRSHAEEWKRTAQYVKRILEGARPAELPVEQPTAFELILNSASAKALGLAFPHTLLLQATRVIE